MAKKRLGSEKIKTGSKKTGREKTGREKTGSEKTEEQINQEQIVLLPSHICTEVIGKCKNVKKKTKEWQL